MTIEGHREDHYSWPGGQEPRPCDYCGLTDVPTRIDFEKGILCEGCDEDLTTIVTPPCPECHERAMVWARGLDLQLYREGAFIQDAFPYLPPATRERFVSRICGSCWDAMFGGLEE